MMEKVIFEHIKEQEYVKITLNRPEKHHAISKSMISQLKEAIDWAKSLKIKCLVLTATGDQSFCAGGDLNYFHSELTKDESFDRLYQMKEILYEIVSFPVLTLCLLNGNAFGGGCELATACDLRIAKKDAVFGFVQGDLGIIPGWGGGVLLYEKVHPTFALQWLTESKLYTANKLKQIGWLQAIVKEEDFTEINKLLKPYLNKTVEQMLHFKQQYKEKLQSLSLSALMNEEVRQCAQFWGSKIHQERVQRLLEK